MLPTLRTVARAELSAIYNTVECARTVSRWTRDRKARGAAAATTTTTTTAITTDARTPLYPRLRTRYFPPSRSHSLAISLFMFLPSLSLFPSPPFLPPAPPPVPHFLTASKKVSFILS